MTDKAILENQLIIMEALIKILDQSGSKDVRDKLSERLIVTDTMIKCTVW